VDVRSPVAGTLQSYAANEDEEVEVGSVLAHIDTEGQASQPTSSSSEQSSTPSEGSSGKSTATVQMSGSSASGAIPQQAASSQQTGSEAGRRPLIQFTHGRANSSPAKQQADGEKDEQSTGAHQSSVGFDAMFPSKASKTYLDLPPMYGRPPISAAEADAIDMGGIM
jgi:pyruvate/2-oxoglutarate dehydrogenase complex dihydrolipoamide acyltransferase (E2) component